MRDTNRIDPFLDDLGKLWKENCPDWRFAQLWSNFQYYCGSDCFYMEESKVLEKMKGMFNVNKQPEKEVEDTDADFFD